MDVVASEDRSTSRLGGLASLLGALLFVVVFVVVGVFVGAEPEAAEEGLARYPEIRAGRTVEDGLYLMVLLLWLPAYLALQRALRTAHAGLATFGSGLGVLGLGVLAAGALPHVAYQRLSNAYEAAEADPAVLAVAYDTMLGIVDMLLIAGLVAALAGVLLLGLAMLRAPAFRGGVAWASVGFGAVGLVAAVWAVVDPLSAVPAGAVFALIVFHLVAGWRLLALARGGVKGSGGEAPPRRTART